MLNRLWLSRCAGGFAIPLLSGCGSGLIETGTLRTYLDAKYESTVRQALDFTCGGAALATILTHYWGRPTTEAEVLEMFRARYPDPALWKAKINEGFSFDDIAFAAEVLGYEASGARVPVDQLFSLNGPAIVHLNKGTFQHFVVLRKARDNVFYVSDPVIGRVGMDADTFRKQYTGSAMAIWRDGRSLPTETPLAAIRDGMSVSLSVRDRSPLTLFDPNNIK